MTTENSHPLASRLPDAAARLGISRSSLYKAIADGKLTSHKLCGRVVILESELQSFVAREARQARVAA